MHTTVIITTIITNTNNTKHEFESHYTQVNS